MGECRQCFNGSVIPQRLNFWRLGLAIVVTGLIATGVSLMRFDDLPSNGVVAFTLIVLALCILVVLTFHVHGFFSLPGRGFEAAIITYDKDHRKHFHFARKLSDLTSAFPLENSPGMRTLWFDLLHRHVGVFNEPGWDPPCDWELTLHGFQPIGLATMVFRVRLTSSCKEPLAMKMVLSDLSPFSALEMVTSVATGGNNLLTRVIHDLPQVTSDFVAAQLEAAQIRSTLSRLGTGIIAVLSRNANRRKKHRSPHAQIIREELEKLLSMFPPNEVEGWEKQATASESCDTLNIAETR